MLYREMEKGAPDSSKMGVVWFSWSGLGRTLAMVGVGRRREVLGDFIFDILDCRYKKSTSKKSVKVTSDRKVFLFFIYFILQPVAVDQGLQS